jgi:acyl-CoA synthetase (AMP-forming)/AMP-acid ligase II
MHLPFSSGTTGLPKRVELSHRSLTTMLRQISAAMPIGPGDGALALAPFPHPMGMMLTGLWPLSQGATIVTASKFEPALFLTAITEHRLTLVVVPPVLRHGRCRQLAPQRRSRPGRPRGLRVRRRPIKDLIKVKGFQVAPAELEQVLLAHPAVGDAAVCPAISAPRVAIQVEGFGPRCGGYTASMIRHQFRPGNPH